MLSKDLFVSLSNGEDVKTCGEERTPCRHLEYTILRFATNTSTTIHTDGGIDKRLNYNFSNTLNITGNLTVQKWGENRYCPTLISNSTQISLFRIKSRMISLKFSDVCFYNVGIFDFVASGSVNFQRCVLEKCILINHLTPLTRIQMNISNTRIQYEYTMKRRRIQTLISATFVNTSGDAFKFMRLYKNCGRLLIKNCSFNNSTFVTIAFCSNYCTMIENTSFSGSGPKNYVILSGNRSVIIRNCEFRNMHFRGTHLFKATILNSRFTLLENKTTIFFFSVRTVEIRGCVFLSNRGYTGTVGLRTVDNASIENCIFQNNSAFEGGAIHSENSTLVIRDSNLTGNKAFISGGAIFSSDKSITLSNVSVSGTGDGPVTGRHFYLTGAENVLENVSLTVSNNTDISPVMIFYDKSAIGSLKVLKLNMNCPIGHSAEYSAFRKLQSGFRKYMALSCKPCGRGKYNLTRGKIFLKTKKRLQVDTPTCSSCELGGVCDSRIKSAGNYWGYLSQNNHVIFTPCLENYCCSPHTTPCTSYDTCAERRTGKLCGVCEEGFSLNFFSASCISNDHCTRLSRSMYYVGHIVLSVVYAVFLMYLKDIMTFLKRNLISNDKRRSERTTSQVSALPSTSQRAVEQDHEEEVPVPVVVAPIPAEDASSKNLISGLIKITFFFYQVESLLRVHTSLKGNYLYNSWLIQGLLSFVFNIKMNIDSNSLIFCPFKNLDSIGKIALKASFIPTLFVVLLSFYWGYCFIYTVRKYVRKPREEQNEGNEYHVLDDAEEMEYMISPFLIRVKSCAVKLTLLGYITISTFAFKCVNCVSLGDESSHLYVQGICFFTS